MDIQERPWKRRDLTGKTFGKIYVIKRIGRKQLPSGKIESLWLCRCGYCNKEFKRMTNSVTQNTKSCGCLKHKIATNSKAIGTLSGGYWSAIKHSAKEREIEVNITQEYAWNLFEQQNHECTLTGEKLVLVRNFSKRRGQQTASLDRIDSSQGYIEGNVHWVHKSINQIKNTMSLKEFKDWCHKVVDNDLRHLA